MSKPRLIKRDVPDAFLEDETRPEFKKYQLHKASIVEWLQRRYPKTSNIMHLYFPSDLEKHIEIKKIFNKFDEDKSNALQRNEFMDMMESLLIKVEEHDLREFYKHVDLDGDGTSLDYGRMMREARRDYDHQMKLKEEEKKMRELQTKNSLVSFPITSENIDNFIEASAKKTDEPTSLGLVHSDSINLKDEEMDEIDLEEEELKKKKPPTFPSTFGTLMNHLTYRIRREKLRKQIKRQNHESIDSAFKNFRELLTLKIEKDTFMNRFNALDNNSEEYKLKKQVLGQMFNYVIPLIDVEEEIKELRTHKPKEVEIEQLTEDVANEIKRLNNHDFFLKEELKEEPQKYEFVQTAQIEPAIYIPPATAGSQQSEKLISEKPASDIMGQSATSKFTAFRPKLNTRSKEGSQTKKNDAFYLTQYDTGKVEPNPLDIKRTFNVPVTPINPNLAIENNNVNLLTGKTRNRVLVNIKQNTFRDINSREGSQASLETRESFRMTVENTNRAPSTDFNSLKGYYSYENFKTDFENYQFSHNNSSTGEFNKIKDVYDSKTSSVHYQNPKTAYPALRIRDVKTPTAEMESRMALNLSPASAQFKIRAQTSFGDLRSLKPMTAASEMTRKKIGGSKTLAQVLLQPMTPGTQPTSIKNLDRVEPLRKIPSTASHAKLPDTLPSEFFEGKKGLRTKTSHAKLSETSPTEKFDGAKITPGTFSPDKFAKTSEKFANIRIAHTTPSPDRLPDIAPEKNKGSQKGPRPSNGPEKQQGNINLGEKVDGLNKSPTNAITRAALQTGHPNEKVDVAKKAAKKKKEILEAFLQNSASLKTVQSESPLNRIRSAKLKTPGAFPNITEEKQ